MAMPVPTAHTMMPKRRLDEVSTEQGLKNVPDQKNISNLGLKFTPDFRLNLCKLASIFCTSGCFVLKHFWTKENCKTNPLAFTAVE